MRKYYIAAFKKKSTNVKSHIVYEDNMIYMVHFFRFTRALSMRVLLAANQLYNASDIYKIFLNSTV